MKYTHTTPWRTFLYFIFEEFSALDSPTLMETLELDITPKMSRLQMQNEIEGLLKSEPEFEQKDLDLGKEWITEYTN